MFNNWQEDNIQNLCEIVNGKTPLRSNNEYWLNGDIPWFTIDDQRKQGKIIYKTNQFITQKALEKSGVKLVPKNSVLICCTASVGEYAITKIPLTTNQQFNSLIIKNTDEIIPEYLFHYSSQIVNKLLNLMGKTTFGFVSVGQLGSIKIKYPDLKTQQKIALILSTVDEEIQKTDQIIQKTEKLKEGLVSRIFFGEKYKTIKIRDVFKTSSGGTPLVKNKEYYENGTIPWLNSGEVSQGYIYSSNKKITELGLKKSSAKIFPIDTVLVAMYGVTAGKVGILKIESSTNQAICGIYPNNDYLPEFLYQYLKTQTDFLLKQGIGAAQPNISQETIKNINIPCFSILEQKKIIEILASLDFKISEDKKSKSKLTSLKNGLMNDIFNQKVEVKNAQ